jgi:hypothetical protein
MAAIVDAKRALSWAEKGKEIGEWHGKRHISAVRERRWGRDPRELARRSKPDRSPKWVKIGNSHTEQMLSALPVKGGHSIRAFYEYTP